MAYDGWIEYNGTEIINLSRTVQLAVEMGIDSVWTSPESVDWIQAEIGVSGYEQVTNAPWYDAGFPASREFAGVVPLSISGLDDSTHESSTVEYLGDGGHAQRGRNATLTIVASVAIVASSERGAEFGKRWLDRTLRASGGRTFCKGADLRYLRYAAPGPGGAPTRRVADPRDFDHA